MTNRFLVRKEYYNFFSYANSYQFYYVPIIVQSYNYPRINYW